MVAPARRLQNAAKSCSPVRAGAAAFMRSTSTRRGYQSVSWRRSAIRASDGAAVVQRAGSGLAVSATVTAAAPTTATARNARAAGNAGCYAGDCTNGESGWCAIDAAPATAGATAGASAATASASGRSGTGAASDGTGVACLPVAATAAASRIRSGAARTASAAKSLRRRRTCGE